MFHKSQNIKVDNEIIIAQDTLEDETFRKVSQFYNNDPFPNYSKDDNLITIGEKGDGNYLAYEFKKFMNYKKKVLEVGSGTCQISNYFAIGTNHEVFAADSAINSLIEGKKFAKNNQLNNVKFIKCDITKNIFEENFFDYIWCNGVLHHTRDARLSFKSISKALKPNGYILIGLYNKFGRARTVLRQFIYKHISKKLVYILDPFLRKLLKNKEKNLKKINAWVHDQYEHPVESLHTFDETLEWFKENNIEFISSLPSLDTNLNKDLFKKKDIGNYFTRFLSQIFMIFSSYGGEGGLYVFIGKKNANNK